MWWATFIIGQIGILGLCVMSCKLIALVPFSPPTPRSAMAGLAQAADVTVNRDVIGRVGEDLVRTLVSHEGADRLSVS
jgi:hypothetical protein